MRILYISSEYPPDTGYGGIATYTMHIAEEMASLGHEVHVVCRAIKKENLEIDGKITVHRVLCEAYSLPMGRFWYIFRKLAYNTISQSLNRIAWAKTVYSTVKKLNRSHKFDIIEYPECGAEGYYLSKENLPTVVRLHTPWTVVREINKIFEHPADCFLQEHLERVTVKKTKMITSPSFALANMLVKRWHIPQATVFPNPLPVASYKVEKNGAGWVYTGRLEFRKGVHILVNAYAIASRSHTPPPLLLVGRPFGLMTKGKTYGQYIRELILDNGLENRVKIIPGVSQADIGDILSCSKIAFYPSLWENFPYACLEAMAAQTAVCAADCGGFPEIIKHGTNGLLFKCGDASSLADLMIQIIENQSNIDELAIEARQWVTENTDSMKIGRMTEDFYSNLIDKKAKKKVL